MRTPKVAAALLLLALAGCGVGEAPANAPANGTAPAAADAFPVTVEHKYGTTTIPAKPQRIVTLGLSDQDAVLALGGKPVGAIDWFKERPYGVWPWTDALWGDARPEVVGERDDYNLEKVLALKPDLIVAEYSGMSQQQYDELSKIAPTLGQPKGFADYGAPYQDMTRAIAKAMGATAAADERIKGIEDKFAQVRAAHPRWQGKTIAAIDPSQPGKIVAFADTDPKAAFLEQLGFTVPQAITDAAVAANNNAAELSYERLDLIDTDVIVVLVDDVAAAKQGLGALPTFAALKAFKADKVVYMSYSKPPIGAALSFNTVLSVPWAVDQAVALLPAE
ncbi:ABC transporter substrate-binding protein [Actinokineospora bangkokensis]|uniref:Iron ABC transporter substrate-binding protein n=1 Tax=Actinokineospora bangkokensis TaxID=1193682 RepID=A0A1Q9LM06_9PSEU|nr:ABC transporter substrate-binding protein [Actinokineospora bangkokensis]OLR93076.1 iron ABC transporter substrate-binding protein [Actinokineospora bangkokensis]